MGYDRSNELKSTYSTVTTYISRWKITDRDLMSDEEKEVEEATEKILEIIEPKDNVEVEESKDDETLKQNDKKMIEVVKENFVEEEVKMENKKNNKLKIKSMVLQGENGTYRVCENGVEITEMGSIISFENINQVDKWADEVKQVFEMLGDR